VFLDLIKTYTLNSIIQLNYSSQIHHRWIIIYYYWFTNMLWLTTAYHIVVQMIALHTTHIW